MDLSVYDYAAGQMPILVRVYLFEARITTCGPESLISVFIQQLLLSSSKQWGVMMFRLCLVS